MMVWPRMAPLSGSRQTASFTTVGRDRMSREEISVSSELFGMGGFDGDPIEVVPDGALSDGDPSLRDVLMGDFLGFEQSPSRRHADPQDLSGLGQRVTPTEGLRRIRRGD